MCSSDLVATVKQQLGQRKALAGRTQAGGTKAVEGLTVGTLALHGHGCRIPLRCCFTNLRRYNLSPLKRTIGKRSNDFQGIIRKQQAPSRGFARMGPNLVNQSPVMIRSTSCFTVGMKPLA